MIAIDRTAIDRFCYQLSEGRMPAEVAVFLTAIKAQIEASNERAHVAVASAGFCRAVWVLTHEGFPCASLACEVLGIIQTKQEACRASYPKVLSEDTPEFLRHDKAFVMEALRHAGSSLRYVALELSNDPEVVLQAIRHASGLSVLEFAGPSARRDYRVVYEAILNCPSDFAFADPAFHHIKEWVRFAMRRCADCFFYAAEPLRHDKELVLEAMSQGLVEPVFRSLTFEPLRADPDILERAFIANPCYILEQMEGMDITAALKDEIVKKALFSFFVAPKQLPLEAASPAMLMSGQMTPAAVEALFPAPLALAVERLINKIATYRNQKLKGYLAVAFIKLAREGMESFLVLKTPSYSAPLVMILASWKMEPGLIMQMQDYLTPHKNLLKNAHTETLQLILLFLFSMETQSREKRIDILVQLLQIPHIKDFLLRCSLITTVLAHDSCALAEIEEISVKALVGSLTTELSAKGLIDPAIDNPKVKFRTTFLAGRRPGAILTYVSQLSDLPYLQSGLALFINTVLKGTFRQERYALSSVHLKHLHDSKPILFEKWVTLTLDRPVFAEDVAVDGARVQCLDHWEDLLLAGTEVVGSCLHVAKDPCFSQALLANILFGKNKLLAVTVEGRIIARAFISIGFDRLGEPLLFLDAIYKASSSYYTGNIKKLALDISEMLKIPLYVDELYYEGVKEPQEIYFYYEPLSLFEYNGTTGGMDSSPYQAEARFRLMPAS